MPEFLKEYIEGNYKIVEYTRDGKTASHTVKTPVIEGPMDSAFDGSSIDEKILYETQYQTVLLEMGAM